MQPEIPEAVAMVVAAYASAAARVVRAVAVATFELRPTRHSRLPDLPKLIVHITP